MAGAATGLTDEKLKKLLADPKYRIELHDLVHSETEKLYQLVKTSKYDGSNNDQVIKTAQAMITKSEEEAALLMKIIAYGCYFGLEDQTNLWSKSLEHLANLPNVAGNTFLLKLQAYPALLVLYAGGLAALSSNRIYNLQPLVDVKEKTVIHDPVPLIIEANCTLLGQSGNAIFNTENRKTPLSDHLHGLLLTNLPGGIIFNDDFDLLFDKWEVIVAMLVADYLKSRPLGPWAPLGRFYWRGQHTSNEALEQIKADIEEKGANWDLLKAGLFEGSLDKATEALDFVRQSIGNMPW